MTRPLSLAHLTVIDHAPPEMVHLAARLGYDAVGLRLIRVTETTPGYPLHADPAALRATRAALDATGLRVLDIEFVRIVPGFRAEALLPFLDAGAALGARHVICAPYDPDHGRLAGNLAALQALAEPRGLSCALEFFPWTDLPDLPAAWRVVQAAGPGVGLLVDALHFDRSGSRPADLAAIPPDRLPFAHLCDAPVAPPYTTEALLHAGRAERLPPGAGGIDLRGLLAALPPGLPLALEVPMAGLAAREGSAAVAARVLAAARALLAG